MNKLFWVLGAVIVLFVSTVLFVRKDDSTKITSEKLDGTTLSKASNEISSRPPINETSTSPLKNRLDEGDLEFFDAENRKISQELMDVVTLSAEAMETYERNNNPLMQKSRMVAKITANMSDAQMVELQTKRQGAVVRSAGGLLNSPYVEREICNGRNVCVVVVANNISGLIVYDGQWANGYIETGVGLEIVKLLSGSR